MKPEESLLLCPHQMESGLYQKELNLRLAEQKEFPNSYIFGYTFEPNDVIDSEYGNLIGIISAVSYDHAIIKHLNMLVPPFAMFIRTLEPVRFAVIDSTEVLSHNVMLDSVLSFDSEGRQSDRAKYSFIPGVSDWLKSLTFYK